MGEAREEYIAGGNDRTELVSHYRSLSATLNPRADHISRFMGGKLKPTRFVRPLGRSLALAAGRILLERIMRVRDSGRPAPTGRPS